MGGDLPRDLFGASEGDVHLEAEEVKAQQHIKGDISEDLLKRVLDDNVTAEETLDGDNAGDNLLFSSGTKAAEIAKKVACLE